MMKLVVKTILLSWLLISTGFSATNDKAFGHPFYGGMTLGFGSTTWNGLVPIRDDQNDAMILSTPIHVQEGGFVGGLVLGYEFTPYFAVEANYRHFPGAHIFFDDESLYAFEHDQKSFHTSTQTINLMAKIMLLVPNSDLRLFSSIGMAGVHRFDEESEQLLVTPSFGAGINLNVTERFMVELGFNYTAGFGEAELSPSDHYVPFLYSGTLTLAYRF